MLIILFRFQIFRFQRMNVAKRQHIPIPIKPAQIPGLSLPTFMLLCTICPLVFEASLKFKLASEISKAASQRDRIQQLQNELIKARRHTLHKWNLNNSCQCICSVYIVYCSVFLSCVLCRGMTARRSYLNFREFSSSSGRICSATRVAWQKWQLWRPQWKSRTRWTVS